MLQAGSRPPLAEGFNRFVASSEVSGIIARSVEIESTEGKTDPYDTHPSLPERIAAARNLPPGEPRANDPKAVTLLNNVKELEKDLFVAMADEFLRSPS